MGFYGSIEPNDGESNGKEMRRCDGGWGYLGVYRD